MSRRRGLAVEGAAALLEQRGLGRRATGRRTCASNSRSISATVDRARRRSRELLGEHLVVGVEVAQVVRGDRAELVEQPPRQPAASRRARRRGRRAARGARRAVEPHRAHPGEVVEADVIDDDAARARRRAVGAIARWKPMATLHRPIARWPSSSSARVTIPTGLVKSTIQAPGAASSRTRSAMSRTTGTVRSALREAAGAGRLLADAAAGERHASRRDSRAAWPPTRSWRSTTSAPSSARVEVAGERPARRRSPARASIRRPARRRPRSRSRVDVVQHELARRSARARARARHELGRVGRAAADHRELHPFTPVSVTPSTKAFWARKKSDDHRRHEEDRRRHRQVPLHLVQRAELRQAERQRPVVAGSPPCRAGARRSRSRRRGTAKSATAAIAGLASRSTTGEQDPQLAAAVDARGVGVLLRDGQEELAQQEDRERVAEEVRQDQRPRAMPTRCSFENMT